MQSEPQRILVENINIPGQTHRVDAAKYWAMRRALLDALPAQAPGLTQAEMVAAVRQNLAEEQFPQGAKAGWWAKTVQLDLEAKGVVVRERGKPLRWHRSSDEAG